MRSVCGSVDFLYSPLEFYGFLCGCVLGDFVWRSKASRSHWKHWVF